MNSAVVFGTTSVDPIWLMMGTLGVTAVLIGLTVALLDEKGK